jgi:anti-sigma B factor antagonist
MLNEPQVLISEEGGRLRLDLRGEIDLMAQPLLDDAYEEVAGAEPGDVLVDLSQVTFLASNGLGFLARIQTHAAATGHMVTLRRPDRSVERVLHLMGFDKVFTITEAPMLSPLPSPPA